MKVGIKVYNVLVVDDEPTALNHICTIINQQCNQYQIIAQAENGQDALEKILKYRPDVVISDVRMPIMDGITLMKKIKEEFPFCITIIVSGYQDFEYMQGALKASVSDYILKPITPKKIKNILDEISLKLEGQYYQERNKFVHRLVNSKSNNGEELKKFFPSKKYYMGISRKNGIIRRFSSTDFELFSEKEENYFVYGRDEMEQLFIVPAELIVSGNFEQIMCRQIEKETSKMNYLTTVWIRECVDVEKLSVAINQLYTSLDTRSVIGLNQFIGISFGEKYLVPISEELINQRLKQIEPIIKDGSFIDLTNMIRESFNEWHHMNMPQLWMERFARQVLYSMRRHRGYSSYDSKYEFLIEDAFYYATTIEELIDSLGFIYSCNFEERKEEVKIDSPDFYEKIKKFIDLHYSEDLSLQVICKEFAVSQSYISRLFRKYEKSSFSNYLTQVRIEESKKLMKNCPDMYIKDIALLVGYKDQFYFSRIFRSVTDMCPSEYIETVI